MQDDIGEMEVRRHCAQGDFRQATTRIVERYGSELFRFVRSRSRNDADAQDVFSLFCEDLWRGLPSFGWRCSLRGWLYKLARHAGHRFGIALCRRAERNVAFADVSSQLAARTASSSDESRAAFVRERLRDLRQRLSEEDQTILFLRVDRELDFRDIARGLVPADMMLSGAELARETARVRKRFQLAKGRLRQWAAEEGLLAAAPADGPCRY
ncbi:MAG TPA: sigma-70 family RNA polymerase sigma factor [Polyangiaceae bacterium]|nr:sigma-70 family RNA polymerase sigma factor [Polyangiaceae bacterium]